MVLQIDRECWCWITTCNTLYTHKERERFHFLVRTVHSFPHSSVSAPSTTATVGTNANIHSRIFEFIIIINEPGEQSTRAHRFVSYVWYLWINQIITFGLLGLHPSPPSALPPSRTSFFRDRKTEEEKRRRSDLFNGPIVTILLNKECTSHHFCSFRLPPIPNQRCNWYGCYGL